MKALYRKYRPTRLADVVGQEQVIKPLSESLEKGKISHAYVFTGPRGTGKTSVARIFAHAVNAFDYQLEDEYLDIIEIDAASNNGVDNIRELREKAIIAPTKGKYKVYIIDEAHMLTKSAANALLKLLEEPPEHVIFMMATTEIDKIPITILSRTQVYTFSLAEPETMLEHLAKIAKAEKINIDQSGLEVVARRGGGSFRDSLSLLDQIATLASSKITAEVLEKALGIPNRDRIKALLEKYKIGDANAIEQGFKDLISSGLRAENITSELLSEIIAHPEAETLPLLKTLPDVGPPFAEAKLLLALLEEKLSPKTASAPTIVKNTELEAKENDNLDVTRVKSSNFDWQSFIAEVGRVSSHTADNLAKSKFELTNNTLHIYPENNFVARILKTSKHNEIIKQALGEYALQIHDANATSAKPKDETIAKISAIMGDVQEIDGSVPF